MPGLGTRPGESATYDKTRCLILDTGFWEVDLDPETGKVLGLF